jgi:hypothetical protein
MPFARSASQVANVVRLKPKRCSMTNVRQAENGSDTRPVTSVTATIRRRSWTSGGTSTMPVSPVRNATPRPRVRPTSTSVPASDARIARRVCAIV